MAKHSLKKHNNLRARTTRSSKARLITDPAENNQLLTEQLSALGLYAAPTIGDGNCLFRALADQLYGSPSRHPQLRRDICDWIAAHTSRYAPFVDDDRGIDTHLRCMRENATYGGHMELSAFAHLTRRNVKVIQPGLVYIIEWNAGDPLSPLSPSHPLPDDHDDDDQMSSVNNRERRKLRRDQKRAEKDRDVQLDTDHLSDREGGDTIYVAYHDWEHFSSIRNLRGPHTGLPCIQETPSQQHEPESARDKLRERERIERERVRKERELAKKETVPKVRLRLSAPSPIPIPPHLDPHLIPLPVSRSASPFPTPATTSTSTNITRPTRSSLSGQRLLSPFASSASTSSLLSSVSSSSSSNDDSSAGGTSSELTSIDGSGKSKSPASYPPSSKSSSISTRVSTTLTTKITRETVSETTTQRTHRSPKRAFEQGEGEEGSAGEKRRKREGDGMDVDSDSLTEEGDDEESEEDGSDEDYAEKSKPKPKPKPKSKPASKPKYTSPSVYEKPLTRRQRKILGLPKPRMPRADVEPVPTGRAKALAAGAGRIVIPGGKYPKNGGEEDDGEWVRNGTGRVDVRGFRELKI